MSRAKQSIEERLIAKSEEFSCALRALDAVAKSIAADLVTTCDQRDVSDDTFRQVHQFREFWVSADSFLEMSDWAENVAALVLRSNTISG